MRGETSSGHKTRAASYDRRLNLSSKHHLLVQLKPPNCWTLRKLLNFRSYSHLNIKRSSKWRMRCSASFLIRKTRTQIQILYFFRLVLGFDTGWQYAWYWLTIWPLEMPITCRWLSWWAEDQHMLCVIGIFILIQLPHSRAAWSMISRRVRESPTESWEKLLRKLVQLKPV